MFNYGDYKVYLACGKTDMRKNINDLCEIVQHNCMLIGRKNWLFSNAQNGANASALIYSVIQTAIANNLKPLYYLEYIFEQIQMNDMLKVSDLLPWSEKIPAKCKNLKTSQHQ